MLGRTRQKGMVVEGDQVSWPGSAAAGPLGRAARAAAAIGTTLDAHRTADELARFLVDEGCDAASVDLADPHEHPRDPGRRLRPAATAGRDDLLGGLEKILREDVRLRALDAGRAVTVSAPGDDAGPTALAVPLHARGQALGVLVAVRAGRPFDDGEAAAVHHAAALAAAHLRHAREHREVSDHVWALQQVLLADPGRPHPNVDLATRYLPAGRGALVGGDWCETVRLHFGRTLLVIGDVMGHGLDAAVDMNAYRSMLRFVASTDLPPHRILRQVDATMSEESGRRPATCLLALLDPARGTAAFAGAGHLPPAVFHRGGTGRLIELPVGPPLGTGLGAYEVTRMPLAPDDTLVLFTDGLVERRGEDIDVSLARLADLRLGPGQDVSALLDDILARLGAEHADDDVAVLAARLRNRP
ncbi:PP2C family protein-serine/threonine phosphatase [Streptomyces tropicalis]|uniref:SpoIIE family protein phosphatase n=1 Tax=Streptomyces tropicalis TaxID=3034234 RepID=A0ABT6AAN6_9ACTN|nr:GAF domain-containing SpoIIE family protein phosphatase [Streptomyces tropicalis]MDF3301518.1 SpoIIE family protein phosphatase [Streptomyces tropicalis]